jgi:2-dehydro-3-deoxy-D-arabinonate dehydratase
MKLYRTVSGILIHHEDQFFLASRNWTQFINREGLYHALVRELVYMPVLSNPDLILGTELLPPVEHQEVWAAGVTYFRSREARMEESRHSGGASFYDKVYEAERPELFFKSTASRVSGHRQPVCIRRDSEWNVPEPELTLFINSKGNIVGYTVGNDMSSRSIEGENPLYLPQAKVYERSAALGPCLLVPSKPLDPDINIRMEIWREGKQVYHDAVPLSQMKRKPAELAAYLFRACRFPEGCFLMTGTCLVPGNEFTLVQGDEVQITIDGIGTLANTVEII